MDMKQFESSLIIFLVLFVLLPASVNGAEPVAMVSDVAGNVKLSGKAEAPEILSELAAGDILVLSLQSRIEIIFYDNGVRYSVAGPAELSLGKTSLQTINGNKPVKKKSKFEGIFKPINLKTSRLAQGAMVMRGNNKSPRLLTLVNTHTLESHPTFKWQSFKNRQDYHLQVTDSTGLTIIDLDVRGISYSAPDSISFKENEQYYWYLSAKVKGKKYTSHGDFIVADKNLRNEIEKYQLATNADIAEQVIHARYLEFMNLQDEANKIWNRVVPERPNSKQLQQRVK